MDKVAWKIHQWACWLFFLSFFFFTWITVYRAGDVFLRICIIAIHHYAKCMWERVGARQHLQRIQWVTAENFASLEGCIAVLHFWCILSEGWHIIVPRSRNLIFENETVECNLRCVYISLKMRCHRAAEEIVKNCDLCAKETKCDL